MALCRSASDLVPKRPLRPVGGGPHVPVAERPRHPIDLADGFRIDTLKFVERDFARIFGNAMREYALSIGKKNFFTFGEVFDNEERIAKFVGRNARDADDIVGVDAALDSTVLSAAGDGRGVCEAP